MARNFKLKGTLDLKDNATKKVQNFSSSTVSSFKKMVAVVGVAGLAGSFAALVKRQIDYADSLQKLNLRLGVSVREMDKLRQVADLSGVKFSALSVGMQRMSRRVSEAAGGAGVASDAIKSLGLNAAELTKIPLDKQLKVILGQLNKIEDNSLRVATAFKLFDTEGVGLLQMANGLDKALEGVNSQMSQDKANQAAALNDQMTRMRETFAQLAQNVIPVLTKAMNALNVAWEWWSNALTTSEAELTKQVNTMKGKLGELKKTRDDMLAGGAHESLLFVNKQAIEDTTKELKVLEAQLEKMRRASSDTSTPKIDNSPVYDESRKNEVKGTAEATAKIIDLRTRLQENLKTLEIQRLTFIGENEQAEIQMVQNKYATLLQEATGNVEAIKLIEEGKVKELALINDKYRQEEAAKRKQLAAITSQYNEKLAGDERKKKNDEMQALVNDFKQSEEEKMALANKTRDFFVNNFSDGFTSIVTGSKKAGDAFKDMLSGMLSQLTKMLANKAFTQLFNQMGGAGGSYGSIFSSLGSILGFAKGGNVKAGEPIVVGEKGPEIFTPKKSGMIIPNDQIEKKYTNNTSGSAGTVNNESNVSVNVNMDASNSGISDPAQANKIGKQLAMMVKGEVMQVMSDQQRFGGMLYTGRRRTA